LTLVAWLEELYPSLFEKVKKYAKTGNFVPIGKIFYFNIGGCWVEMDCNIPSGESLCRQFLHGQRYFKKAFGETSKVFW
jgi:alpha-mannosidase